MIDFIRRLVRRSPKLVEADRQIEDLNSRVEGLVKRATINDERKWFLKVVKENESLPRTFECQEVDVND